MNMLIYEPTREMIEEDYEVFKTWLTGVVKLQPVTITFTKKDGTERVMRCTLHPDELPAVEVNENYVPRKKSSETISVYDIVSKGWRSFSVRSVKKIEFASDQD